METPDAFLKQIEPLMQSGKYDDARILIDGYPTHSINDSVFHMELARLCEECGWSGIVFREYNLALRDAPESTEVLKKLAEAHIDSGNSSKAEKLLRKALSLSPSGIEIIKLLGEVLEETGNIEEAAKVYENGYKDTGDISIKSLKDALGKSMEEESMIDEQEKYRFPLPTDNQLLQFIELFSGREGVYARQWVSHTGDTGYTVIKEPFTFHVAKNHIAGNYTVGIYPIRMDNTVNFIAFDIDMPPSILSKAVTNEKRWNEAKNKLFRTAKGIVNECVSNDIFAFIEESGYKGYHCWIFLDMPLPARVARNFASVVLASIKSAEECEIEIFPKQKFVKPGGLGNLIKIPFGIHRKSMKRGLFVGANGMPYENQFDFLQRIVRIKKSSIYAYLESKKNIMGKIFSEEAEKSTNRQGGEITEVSGLPAPQSRQSGLPAYIDEYNIEKDEEFQYLLLKCPVIKCLFEKANATSHLTNDERIVITHSAGHLQNGPLAVNSILAKCIDVDQSAFLKSRLKGNPVSCPRIRSRIPDVTSQVNCNCNFGTLVNIYPTPVLHVQNIKQSAIGGGIDSIAFESAVSEFLKMKKSLRETLQLLELYQKKLEDFFSGAGVDVVNTPYGRLVKRIESDGKINFILEM